MIDNIRVSEQAKRKLITLKRRTGIEHWNILCRWAICKSLSDDSLLVCSDQASVSNVEMSWRTFSGSHGAAYEAILRQAYKLYSSNTTESIFFHSHLDRGLSHLVSNKDCGSIEGLLERA